MSTGNYSTYTQLNRHSWADAQETDPMPSLSILDDYSATEITWDEVYALKQQKIKTSKVCLHFIYGHYRRAGGPRCCDKNCKRIHVRNIFKLRAIFGNRFKSTVCKNGYKCKHGVCMFDHEHDRYFLTNDDIGTPCCYDRPLSEVITERDNCRDNALLEEQNANTYPTPTRTQVRQAPAALPDLDNMNLDLSHLSQDALLFSSGGHYNLGVDQWPNYQPVMKRNYSTPVRTPYVSQTPLSAFAPAFTPTSYLSAASNKLPNFSPVLTRQNANAHY
jgi:hypothetical protein